MAVPRRGRGRSFCHNAQMYATQSFSFSFFQLFSPDKSRSERDTLVYTVQGNFSNLGIIIKAVCGAWQSDKGRETPQGELQ